MTISEMIAVASAMVAALALVLNFSKDRRSTISDTQVIRDKLEVINDTTRDTRDDVRQLDRKLDDHAARITKIETELKDHDRRITKLEG